MLFIVGIIAGFALPIQTSINAELGKKVQSAYLASMVSMVVAACFMLFLSLITMQWPVVSLQSFQRLPSWLWIGGLLGDIALTINVLLLPKLGAVQTIIMPLLGQIIASMTIDDMGWFHSLVHSFSVPRLLGILVLFIGVFMIIKPTSTSKGQNNNHGKELWQLLGIGNGILLAIQTAINGALNKEFMSPIKAGTFSFLTGGLIMVIMVGIIQHNFRQLGNVLGADFSLSIWSGGILGALYTTGNLFLAPLLGTGTAIVVVLLGNMIESTLIDGFGLLGNPKRPITIKRIIGLVILLLGVLMIQEF